MARSTRDTSRPMAGTWYTRRIIGMQEDVTLRRKVQNARRAYQSHQVFAMAVVPASITATVQGSQIDPFGVLLTRVPGDPAAVVSMLQAQGATAELLAVARGRLGATLGELVLPEAASDIQVSCTCPDPSDECAHALAVIYEFCAAADTDPSLILDFAGVPLSGLLARVTSAGNVPAPPVSTPTEQEEWDAGAAAFYGEGIELPPLPEPVPLDPMAILDPAVLRTALRRSGSTSADVGEAQDELAELYERIRHLR